MNAEQNTVTALKPVRVIQELTPSDAFIRAVERARTIRASALARADADFVERVQQAQVQYLPSAPSTSGETSSV